MFFRFDCLCPSELLRAGCLVRADGRSPTRLRLARLTSVLVSLFFPHCPDRRRLCPTPSAPHSSSLTPGAGVEHMTAHYGAGVMPERMSDAVLSNPESSDCLIPMGITSENVAKQYNVSRDTQDTFAANSFAKAAAAQKAGKFKEEIVPVRVSDSLCYQDIC